MFYFLVSLAFYVAIIKSSVHSLPTLRKISVNNLNLIDISVNFISFYSPLLEPTMLWPKSEMIPLSARGSAVTLGSPSFCGFPFPLIVWDSLFYVSHVFYFLSLFSFNEHLLSKLPKKEWVWRYSCETLKVWKCLYSTLFFKV